MDYDRLSGAVGQPKLPVPTAHKKRRSHSRGNSITNFDHIVNHPSAIPSPPLSRSSSHRRRSSVSTRRESAELMGASLPEDGLKDGSKVDMHLRALFALEGRSSNSSSPSAPTFGFSKVELPDFGAEASVEKRSDLTATPLPSKPSFNANNSLTGKRDSFGKLLTPASTSTKKELQTLLEEDEGEDQGSEPGSPVVPVPAPRHRPRSLNLRSSYLRLSASLPTPSPTPSVRTPKLKSLTLASSTVVTSSPPHKDTRRSSTLSTSHSTPLLSAAEVELVHRQSSISYRRSNSEAANLSLPSSSNAQTLTPSPSPTLGNHRRSLSPSELLAQSAYFAQSHTSFLARIVELEAALARATTPSPAPTEPPEELLEMLAHLKSERDQLKRSLDELVSRYNDQEKQISALGRRLDNEKRDGWVSKEKLSRAEAEKRTLTKEKEDLNEELATLRQQLQNSKQQLHNERESRQKAEQDLYAALDAQRAPAAPYPYPTSYKRGSVDSQATHSDGTYLQFGIHHASVDMLTVREEEDSDGSILSRPISSTSFGSLQPSSINTPDDLSMRRDSLSSGWSFANASRRVKAKPSVDNFFTCLDDSDSGVPAESFGRSSRQSESSPGAMSFGFGPCTDDDEDSTFNFGQPSTPSPFPRSDESDDDAVKIVDPSPFIDEEDAGFSFAAPEEFDVAAAPSLAQAILTNPSVASGMSSPPMMPNFVDPSTPRPRHKARDSMHLRRRSRNDKHSVDSSSTDSAAQHASPPRSAPSANTAFTFPRLAAAPMTAPIQMPILNVSIPSARFGSSLSSFGPDILSPPPPRKSAIDESPKARISPPIFMPTPPPRSAARGENSRTGVAISRTVRRERSSQSQSPSQSPSQSQSQTLPRTPPPSTPSKSPLSNLSFSSLVNLFPSSWSPRSSISSPTSSQGRDSIDRTYVSRERQLNRLRNEVEHQRMASRGEPNAL